MEIIIHEVRKKRNKTMRSECVIAFLAYSPTTLCLTITANHKYAKLDLSSGKLEF